MKYFLVTEQLNGSQDDRARARASEFVNNNFNNQDFSSVDSDYSEYWGASEDLDFNKVIGEMLLL